MLNTKLFSNLSQVRNNAIGHIDMKTTVSLMGGKKNPMQGRITKISTGAKVQFFGNTKSNGYVNKLKRLAAKNGQSKEVIDTIQANPRKWGERIKETPLITNKGNVYVEFIYLKPATKTEYFFDGKPIAKRDIEGLKASRVYDAEKVNIVSPKLESITALRMGNLSA